MKSTVVCDVTPRNSVEVRDVSKEHTASVFRVEQTPMNQEARRPALFRIHNQPIGYAYGVQ
jgi:hypothetical protein